MKRKSLRARDYIEHMLEATQRISSYLADRREQDFQTDTLLQDAVIRNLEVLGEASKNFLSAVPDAQNRFPRSPSA